jgi:hypothetical protein
MDGACVYGNKERKILIPNIQEKGSSKQQMQ